MALGSFGQRKKSVGLLKWPLLLLNKNTKKSVRRKTKQIHFFYYSVFSPVFKFIYFLLCFLLCFSFKQKTKEDGCG